VVEVVEVVVACLGLHWLDFAFDEQQQHFGNPDK
jgi:hypothetical protein